MSTETNINIDLNQPTISAFIGATERKLIDPDYEKRKSFVLQSGFRETAERGPDLCSTQTITYLMNTTQILLATVSSESLPPK